MPLSQLAKQAERFLPAQLPERPSRWRRDVRPRTTRSLPCIRSDCRLHGLARLHARVRPHTSSGTIGRAEDAREDEVCRAELFAALLSHLLDLGSALVHPGHSDAERGWLGFLCRNAVEALALPLDWLAAAAHEPGYEVLLPLSARILDSADRCCAS